MIDFTRKPRYGYEDMVRIIHLLRQPGGCPWDQEQTHQSIRRCFLEETYEVLEAIDEDDPVHMCEELGDVLTQVVFHGTMEQDAGRFTMEDIYDGVAKKMILRHPHIFGDETAEDSETVLVNWEAIKKQEKGHETHTQVLRAVPKNLPANWRAEKLQKKAARSGFSWENPAQAAQELAGKTQALCSALEDGSNVDQELGDVLFAAANVAACLGRDPEESLHAACEKFIDRFSRMEHLALRRQQPLEGLSREELLQLWNAAKQVDEPGV